MLVADAGRDDAERGIALDHHGGAFRFVPTGDFGELPPQAPMRRAGIGGNHDARGDVALEGGRSRRRSGVARRDDHAFGMTHAGGDAQEHGKAPALGDIDGAQGEIIRFLGIGGLEHGHAGGHCVAAIVLLILAGSHARIVGRDDYQRAGDAGVGHGEEWIGRHVQADVFHGGERAAAGERHADRDLERHLFVRRPLGVAAERSERFQNFGGWRARVAGAQVHPRIQSGQRHRLVAAQQQPARRAPVRRFHL